MTVVAVDRDADVGHGLPSGVWGAIGARGAVQREVREKLGELEALGVDPYPATWSPTHAAADAVAAFVDEAPELRRIREVAPEMLIVTDVCACASYVDRDHVSADNPARLPVGNRSGEVWEDEKLVGYFPRWRDLPGTLAVPSDPSGLVVFAHGSGSSRLSPRNRAVARALSNAGLATLLIDLLTPDEEAIETIVDAAFWASLRREEGLWPRISLALVPPDAVGQPLRPPAGRGRRRPASRRRTGRRARGRRGSPPGRGGRAGCRTAGRAA